MPDFAPNFTARYRIRYSSQSKSHSMMWRIAASETDPSALITKIGLFLDDMATSMWEDWTINSAEFAPADSDVFLPAALPTFGGGEVELSTAVASDAAVPISFVGRSVTGGRARMFLYGTNFPSVIRSTQGLDYRITSVEAANVGDAIVRLNETSPAIVANDNGDVVWYEYVNVKANDAWVRKLRRG